MPSDAPLKALAARWAGAKAGEWASVAARSECRGRGLLVELALTSVRAPGPNAWGRIAPSNV
jgi:hypothetical protein